jgi:hypothetical protein
MKAVNLQEYKMIVYASELTDVTSLLKLQPGQYKLMAGQKRCAWEITLPTEEGEILLELGVAVREWCELPQRM